jgi:hypothetical protein
MRAARGSESTPGVHTDTGVFSPTFARALREEEQEEVGREGAGEGVEATREVAQGRGSQSSMRATRGSESTQGVHKDTGVFGPPRATGGARGGAARGGARGGAIGRGRGSGGGARGSARGGVHANIGFFIPSPPFEGTRAGQEATCEEVCPASLTQDVEQAVREGVHGGGARGSARGGVHVHADTGVFSPLRAKEDAQKALAAMRE